MFSLHGKCCEKHNIRMNFTTLHVDFEERMLVVVKEFFQTTSSKHVIFTSVSHDGEKYKIQDFQKSTRKVTAMLANGYTTSLYQPFPFQKKQLIVLLKNWYNICPMTKKLKFFADYVLSTDVDDNALFLSYVWAKTPTTARNTNNGFDFWCFNVNFSNISAISWCPV